jgi:hypothetical protein
MAELRSELLYRMTLEVAEPLDIGAGPRGQRLVIPFKGGRFEGPKLRGEVLVAGGDWLLHRPDGVFGLMCGERCAPMTATISTPPIAAS